jgi:hypothetical protein
LVEGALDVGERPVADLIPSCRGAVKKMQELPRMPDGSSERGRTTPSKKVIHVFLGTYNSDQLRRQYRHRPAAMSSS